MKTYIITGANRGLGLEFVRQISSASDSNTIFACVRSLQGDLDELKALAAHKSSIHIIECDTSSVPSVGKCANEVSKLLNGSQLNFLINNAGVNAVPTKTALEMTPEDLQMHMEINVVGPSEMVKAFKTHLADGSTVLNMTSGLGSFQKRVIKCCTYAISKAALNMLTVHQADTLKEKGVRVILMDPGWVQTRMGGEGAILTPQQSIEGMLKLLHENSKDDSGTFYQYDGDIVPW